jgi:hypothetical protein
VQAAAAGSSGGSSVNWSSVDDDALFAAVSARLLQSDCRERGFVLTLSPAVSARFYARFLRDSAVQPNRVLCLEMKGDESAKSVGARRYDPLTEQDYTLDGEGGVAGATDALNGAILKRLKCRAHNELSAVARDNSAFESGARSLLEAQKAVAKTVDVAEANLRAENEQAAWEEIDAFLRQPLATNAS